MNSSTHLPKLDLTTFFLSISTAALQALGEGKKDLLFAHQNIELLQLMLEKTKGNLTESESTLLNQLLFQLHMAYAEAVKK